MNMYLGRLIDPLVFMSMWGECTTRISHCHSWSAWQCWFAILKVLFCLSQWKPAGIVFYSITEAIDTLHPVHHILNNKNILSNWFNSTLSDLTLARVYAHIQGITDIAGLSALLNNMGGSNQEVYHAYHDSKYYKVDWFSLHSFFHFLQTRQVNFLSLAKHSMVEFCQHQGTVLVKSAINWANFIIHFVEYTMNASDNTVRTGSNTIDDLAHLVHLPWPLAFSISLFHCIMFYTQEIYHALFVVSWTICIGAWHLSHWTQWLAMSAKYWAIQSKNIRKTHKMLTKAYVSSSQIICA